MVKKDGKREPFDRGKLERAIGHACRKRDVDSAKIERLISGIQRQLETRGDEVLFYGTVTPHEQTLARLVETALQGDLKPVRDAEVAGLPERVRRIG